MLVRVLCTALGQVMTWHTKKKQKEGPFFESVVHGKHLLCSFGNYTSIFLHFSGSPDFLLLAVFSGLSSLSENGAPGIAAMSVLHDHVLYHMVNYTLPSYIIHIHASN